MTYVHMYDELSQILINSYNLSIAFHFRWIVKSNTIAIIYVVQQPEKIIILHNDHTLGLGD